MPEEEALSTARRPVASPMSVAPVIAEIPDGSGGSLVPGLPLTVRGDQAHDFFGENTGQLTRVPPKGAAFRLWPSAFGCSSTTGVGAECASC